LWRRGGNDHISLVLMILILVSYVDRLNFLEDGKALLSSVVMGVLSSRSRKYTGVKINTSSTESDFGDGIVSLMLDA
jgi:hypothetical protein